MESKQSSFSKQTGAGGGLDGPGKGYLKLQFSPQGGIGGGFDGPGNEYSKSQFLPQDGIGGGFGGGPGNRNRGFTHPGHGEGPFKVLNVHYIFVNFQFSNLAGRWQWELLLFF